MANNAAWEAEFDDEEVIDYRYYFELVRTVLLKHYRLIAAFSTACLIATLFYVQSQAPVYVATTTLHVAPKDSFFSFDQWAWVDEDKYQETQIGLLQSKKLMRRVVESINLHEVGKLTPQSFDAGIASVIKRWIARLRGEVDRSSLSDEDRIESTAGELLGLVSIGKPQDREYSNLMNVTVRMAKPDLAALTANTIAEEYMSLVFENEIESARRNQQFLTDRLTILREELREAEQRLQDYREQENIVTRSSGTTEVDEELAALSNRYFEARENRLRKENLYQQLQNVNVNSKSWEKLPAITNHPSIAQIQADLNTLNQRKSELSRRYGSRHNKMIALNSEIESVQSALASQVADIIAGIRNDYELSIKIEKAAEETLNNVRDRKQQLGRKEFQLNDLTQDVEAKREVYSIFLERLNQDGAAGPARNDNLWIADPAIVPSYGQRTSLIRASVASLLLSFGLAMGLGLLFELANNKIVTTDDVERKLGRALIGILPLIPRTDGTPSGLTTDEYLNNPDSRFAEALRTVRTSLSLATLNREGTNKFLVTASQMSEGKTSVALSLAVAFGQMSRTIILDGDLRKPSLERVLTTSHHKLPGLTDVIAGTVSLEEAIQHREEEGIDLLFSGSRTIRPLELLSSNRFGELMEELSQSYDTIIIDSPPCVAVSDAYVLSTQVDTVMFVVKSNEATVPIIRHCLGRFENIDANVAGVLLNQVDLESVHHYGRYQDYYSYHSYGETEKSEPTIVKS